MILQAVEIATAVTLGLPALVREGMTWSDLRVQALSCGAGPARAAAPPAPSASTEAGPDLAFEDPQGSG